MLTDQCTAECEMCCFSCSPNNNNVMDIKIVKRVIDQAEQMKNINVVGFSGEEVFLQYDMLSDIIEYASSRNLRTTCTTNGFCASTYKYAPDKLLRLKDR